MSAAGPIRVLRIIDRLNVGGPAKHVVWLTAGLHPEKFQTLLVTGRVAEGEGDMGYFAEAAGVQAVTIDAMSRELSLADVAVVWKLVRLMRRFRPDVVHTHKSKAGAVGRMATLLYRWTTLAALRGAPHACTSVHTFHGHTFAGYFGALKARTFLVLERLLARWATDRIVVIGERQRREISGRYRVGRPEQFRVVPLGIDLDEVATEPCGFRAEIGVEPGDFVVATVGRLCPIKNQRLFLEAVRRTADRVNGARVRFVVVGDGELRGELESEARRLGVAERVVFTGFRRDAARLYPEFDLVVLTSRNEGTPVTLIEALVAGKAVVSTEVGGVADLLGDRIGEDDGVARWDHGLSVASGDAPALSRAIGRLLRDPELRAGMGARGRAFVRERLSKGRLIADVETLYGELAASRNDAGNARDPAEVAPPVAGEPISGALRRAGGLRAEARSVPTSPRL